MINLLVSVATFAGVKLVFLWMFGSDRKRKTRVSQSSREDPERVETPDGRFQASALQSSNGLSVSSNFTWTALSVPS